MDGRDRDGIESDAAAEGYHFHVVRRALDEIDAAGAPRRSAIRC